MKDKTRITLVRHGHVHNPKAVIYGRLPRFRLSDTGRREARQTAEALKNEKFAAVFSSPLLRARQTAGEIMKFHPDLKLKTTANITEVLVSFQGEPRAELKRFLWDVYCRRTVDTEQPPDVLERTQRFVKRICRVYKGRHCLAVTHGDVILFLTLWALGYEVTPKNKLNLKNLDGIREYPATASATRFCFDPDSPGGLPSVSYFNPRTDPGMADPFSIQPIIS